MKLVPTCKKCGAIGGKRHVDVVIPAKDRAAYELFDAHAFTFQPALVDRPKFPIIPSPGQVPCPLCEIGVANIGPSGCGMSETCKPYAFYMLGKTIESTASPEAFKDFIKCDALPATWNALKKKGKSAQPVGGKSSSPLRIFSATARSESFRKSVERKSRQQKSSKKP